MLCSRRESPTVQFALNTHITLLNLVLIEQRRLDVESVEKLPERPQTNVTKNTVPVE